MTARDLYCCKIAGFTLFPSIPLLAPIGYYAGLPWLSSLFVFFAIPGLDLLIGSDRTRPLDRPVSRAARAWLYVVPHIYAVAWLATLVWAASVLSEAASLLDRVSILVGVALGSAFATCRRP